MSEFSLSKLMWVSYSEGAGAMESCYKLYTWINHTILMLLLQIFWKMSQISDYFRDKPVEDTKTERALVFTPLTRQSKYRRHIRSMSDVQSSTPYKLPTKSWHGSSQNIYDSDTRARRIRYYNKRLLQTDSSDSSDTEKLYRKIVSLRAKVMKPYDSMRFL
ncbi:uncharacterized protein LOC128201570 [Galleria mellonella]|uniref:Uncharacterized protein LOC128201570 n=1 Tax=Galleria mellonella TaxID=7137 RepID=A0ABM3MU70_GALME|nr:uncharacterized protein LOC128201570 [Galleria mellonella]